MAKSRLEKKETQKREQRGGEEVGWDYKLSQFAPSNVLPLARLTSWWSHNLLNNTTDWGPSVQMHEHISYSNYHSALLSHLVMWNAFCPTPEVSIVFNSVQKSKVSSKTQGNLLTENHCAISRHVTYFHHIVSWNIHFYEQWEEWEHCEERLKQSKTQTQ